MQRSTNFSIGAIAALMVILALALSQPLAFADGASGKFNPQTQFPAGTTVTFTSLNGVAAQRVNFNKPRFAQYDAAISIMVKVEELTRDGGIRWKVLSGTFTIKGQTYTVTGGGGLMNTFDEVGMRGETTGPDGADYRWRLRGFASLHNGVVIIALRGGIATIQSDDALLGYRLVFIATMSGS